MTKWLTISDFPNYEASSEGKIRNKHTGRIMKTAVNKNGYEQVCLRRDNKQYTKKVHRLVADAFYRGNQSDLDINHIDGCKLNNKIDNLEYCTRKENIRHAFDSGLKRPSSCIKVRVVETGRVYNSFRECARDLGFNQAMINQYFAGEVKSCKGYHFEKLG